MIVEGEFGSEVISDPAAVSRVMVDFYSEWFGRDRKRWYLEGEGHPLYRDDEQGEKLRHMLDEGKWKEIDFPAELKRGLACFECAG